MCEQAPTMPSSTTRFLTWGWLLRVGLICIIVNGILLYIIITFFIIPYLDRGGSLEDTLHQKQTSSLVQTVESPVESPVSISTATQIFLLLKYALP